MDAVLYLVFIFLGVTGYLNAEQDEDYIEEHYTMPGFAKESRTPEARRNSIRMLRLGSAFFVVMGCVGLIRSIT